MQGESMSKRHPIIKEVQTACQKHYACFAVAVSGLASQKRLYSSAPAGAKVFFSDKDPRFNTITAALYISELKEYLEKDGAFADALAKSLLVAIYAEWDEYYRPKYAKAVGIRKNQVKCPLFGDLRLVRNCIVHCNSVLQAKHTKFKTLNWSLSPGKLRITQDMFSIFVKQINSLIICGE